MALQRNLRNPYTKQNVDAYCVIPRLSIFDLDKKVVEFSIYYYNEVCTKSERTGSSVLPFGSQKFCLYGEKFDQYFATSILENNPPMKQAYLAIKESNIVEDVETNPWALATDLL